ncbi:D-galactose 1-dehydrogenase [Sphingomonas gellani]|uniref:D-galactose 1-dehydrogenase n=1 Tax=Sphingomonas gellani TaxID=1166340 RepID=A0A1H8BJ25_9SPHN|nr:Gfo/Idh/MocA family oxidoreductase [Sphingomonas gellani]SEM82783.1 D-galactose 1-dehydrogenase [Sphingomonas gellani]
MMAIPIAIVGVGKIARDQHLPTLAASNRWRLAGVVSRHADDLDVSAHPTLTALKAAVPELAAVSICTPPIGRTDVIREALELGLDVMVEKPPAATISEAERFASLARDAGRSLFLTWHSREASGVAPLSAWLNGRTINRVAIEWMEDVRVWHPGQEWIWEPGIGVFDPGINALSILTRLLGPVSMTGATLRFPANKASPIAASLAMEGGAGELVSAEFSFDQRGPQTWTMTLDTDGGQATLLDGGGRLEINGSPVDVPEGTEYGRLYDRFAELVGKGEIDADLAPFRLVTDAFLIGRREQVDAFSWSD